MEESAVIFLNFINASSCAEQYDILQDSLFRYDKIKVNMKQSN